MTSKLKATRAAHKSVITKLLKKFDELKKEEENDEENFTLVVDQLTEKRKLLSELNSQILNLLTDEEVENEITDADEYYFNLESKIRQIRKFIQNLKSSL